MNTSTFSFDNMLRKTPLCRDKRRGGRYFGTEMEPVDAEIFEIRSHLWTCVVVAVEYRHFADWGPRHLHKGAAHADMLVVRPHSKLGVFLL